MKYRKKIKSIRPVANFHLGFQNLLHHMKIRSARKMSLGDSRKSWAGFVTAGLGGEIKLDITKDIPDWMINRYELIWSERMLEHVSANDIPLALDNISLLLKPGTRCRMCLPICFWGNQRINMVRLGNEEKCKKLGHVTWFTYKGYGPITDSCMGSKMPPQNLLVPWSQVLNDCGLRYVPIRHYCEDGSLFINESLLKDPPGVFVDEPQIKIVRLDSLIFDLVKA